MTTINQADKIYVGSSLVSAVYAGTDKVWPAEYKLLTSFTPTDEFNSFTGEVGMVFGLTTNMTFNKIGARCGTGGTGFTVTLNKNDGSFTQIASAVIDFTGAAVGEFRYIAVPDFTLIGDSATTYTLHASVVDGQPQYWCGSSPAAIANKFSLVSCYFNSPPPTQYLADQSYVGLDLDYG